MSLTGLTLGILYDFITNITNPIVALNKFPFYCTPLKLNVTGDTLFLFNINFLIPAVCCVWFSSLLIITLGTNKQSDTMQTKIWQLAALHLLMVLILCCFR